MTRAALESRLRIRTRARSTQARDRPVFAQAEDNIQFQFVSH